jgi:hypothetical protein
MSSIYDRSHDRQATRDRLAQLHTCPNDWDGPGTVAPSHELLQAIEPLLDQFLSEPHDLPRPRIYPTPNGHVQLEWSISPWAIDVQCSLDALVANATHTDDQREIEQTFSFSPESIERLIAWLAQLSSS